MERPFKVSKSSQVQYYQHLSKRTSQLRFALAWINTGNRRWEQINISEPLLICPCVNYGPVSVCSTLSNFGTVFHAMKASSGLCLFCGGISRKPIWHCFAECKWNKTEPGFQAKCYLPAKIQSNLSHLQVLSIWSSICERQWSLQIEMMPRPKVSPPS